MSANSDYETLKGLIAQLNEFRQEYGGEDCQREFEIHALDSNLGSLEDCQKLAELGVTDICVTPWNPYSSDLGLKDKLEAIDSFAAAFITSATTTGAAQR